MNTNDSNVIGPDTPSVASIDETEAEVAAWQEIAPGRYMPRRVRGSCKGRVLG